MRSPPYPPPEFTRERIARQTNSTHMCMVHVMSLSYDLVKLLNERRLHAPKVYWRTPPDHGCDLLTWSRDAPMISVASVLGPSTVWFKSTGNISSLVAIDLSSMVLPCEGSRIKWPMGRLGCCPCLVSDFVFKRTTKSCKNMYDDHKTQLEKLLIGCK